MSNHKDFKLTVDFDPTRPIGHVRLSEYGKQLFEQQKINGSFAVIAPQYKTAVNTDGSHVIELEGLALLPAEQLPNQQGERSNV